MMVLKIIQYFRQHIDISKRLVVLSWRSRGLYYDESVKPPSTTNNILNSLLDYVGTKTRVEFKGSCLKQDKISFDHG